ARLFQQVSRPTGTRRFDLNGVERLNRTGFVERGGHGIQRLRRRGGKRGHGRRHGGTGDGRGERAAGDQQPTERQKERGAATEATAHQETRPPSALMTARSTSAGVKGLTR